MKKNNKYENINDDINDNNNHDINDDINDDNEKICQSSLNNNHVSFTSKLSNTLSNKSSSDNTQTNTQTNVQTNAQTNTQTNVQTNTQNNARVLVSSERLKKTGASPAYDNYFNKNVLFTENDETVILLIARSIKNKTLHQLNMIKRNIYNITNGINIVNARENKTNADIEYINNKINEKNMLITKTKIMNDVILQLSTELSFNFQEIDKCFANFS